MINKEKIKNYVIVGFFSLVMIGIVMAITQTYGNNIITTGNVSADYLISNGIILGGKTYNTLAQNTSWDCIYASDGSGTTTDISTCLSQGGKIFIKTNITTSNGLSITQNNTHVVFATNAWLKYTGNDYAINITGNGRTSTTTSLTSNVSIGDVTVTVVDGTKFAPDEFVIIHSTDPFQPGESETKGEIHQIKSISGNTLSLMEGTYMSYSASTTNVTKVEMIDNVRIDNVKVVCDRTQSLASGLLTDHTVAPIIDSLLVRDCGNRGFNIRNTLDGTISNVRVINANTSGFGYGGIVGRAAARNTVNNMHVSNVRNGFDCGGSSVGGIPFENRVENIYVSQYSLYGLHTHPDCGHIEYHHGSVMGNNAGSGILMQGKSFVIDGIVIRNVANCVRILQGKNRMDGGLVSHITCDDATTNGILLENIKPAEQIIFSDISIQTDGQLIRGTGNVSNVIITDSFLRGNYGSFEPTDGEQGVLENITITNSDISANADYTLLWKTRDTENQNIILNNNRFSSNRYTLYFQINNVGYNLTDMIINGNTFFCLDNDCDYSIYLRGINANVTHVVISDNVFKGYSTAAIREVGTSDITKDSNIEW